jgi:DNA-binding MarR family transcriptional regulator
LVQQGHLRRAQEQDDRRVQHYSLTAGGAEIKAKIQGLLDNCEAALQARLSPKARREAERGMAALIAAMAE